MDEPITGVRGSDAVAFVHWVNQISGGDTEYRLPIHGELDHPAVQRALARTPPLSTWTVSQHSPELWTPAGSVHPCLIDAATMKQHIGQDLERAAPLLARLLLVRCAVVLRDHARGRRSFRGWGLGADRDPIAEHCSAFASHLAGDPQQRLAITGDTERAIALDLAIDHEGDRDLTELQSQIKSVSLAVSIALRAGVEVEFHGPDPDTTYPREILEEVHRNHASAIEEVRRLTNELNPGSADKVPSRALSLGLDQIFHARAVSDWRRQFVEEFVTVSGSVGYTRVVNLDVSADQVRIGCKDLLTLLKSAERPTTWVDQIASRLQDNALSVFNRKQPLTVDLATRIRLAALCLASEADTHGGNPVGDIFRSVATDITLMERRATRQTPARETITLAIE